MQTSNADLKHKLQDAETTIAELNTKLTSFNKDINDRATEKETLAKQKNKLEQKVKQLGVQLTETLVLAEDLEGRMNASEQKYIEILTKRKKEIVKLTGDNEQLSNRLHQIESQPSDKKESTPEVATELGKQKLYFLQEIKCNTK